MTYPLVVFNEFVSYNVVMVGPAGPPPAGLAAVLRPLWAHWMVSMFNPRLTETLTDFPFARLNALISPIAPPAHLSMINMSVGEPQGAMPAFARQIVNDEIDGWNRYPPNQGIPDLNVAIVEWLGRR